MKLKSIFLTKMNIDKFVIKKRFHSKKNQVYLVTSPDFAREDCVLKLYNNPQSLIKDVTFLESLKREGVRVPKILYQSSNYIILEHLEGETLTDLFDSMEKNGSSPEQAYAAIDALCEWLAHFYSVCEKIIKKQVIMKDVNLRNFIFCDEMIYGIDFEEVNVGLIEEDIGKICAFILTYEPSYTSWKLDLAKYFRDKATKMFNLNPELVLEELNNELSAIKKRREGPQ